MTTGILSLTIEGIAPGMLLTQQPVTFSLTANDIWASPMAAADGGLGPSACTVDITLDQQIRGTSSYKVQGAVHCAGPVPSAGSMTGGLQVDQLDFVVDASM